jgi:hypothetical protein
MKDMTNPETGIGIEMPPCMTIHCEDECCRHGVDVLPEERAALIANNLASPNDFTGPQEDEVGDLLYRTQRGPRGCVFLLPTRGCRLHSSGQKPSVCKDFPRDAEEILEAYQAGDLPCLDYGGGQKYAKPST